MGVAVPRAGSHGGDGPLVARALGMEPTEVLDLSQSLNPFAPDPAAAVARHLDAVGFYPDPTAATLALAEALGVDGDRLLLTNGGSEAIRLVSDEVGGRVQSEPEFALHPRGDTGPIWRSDPHSPSGRLATDEESADVWDEAFFPLATGRWSAGRPGIVVGSLTKLFACPGLRLGYVIADDIERFARRQPAWSVGSLPLAVLPELLASCDLERWTQAIDSARRELAELFLSSGFVVEVADAPWILVHGPRLRERLAIHGVVVRDCTSFGLPGVVRVAVPSSENLARLESALDRVLNR